VVPALEVLAHTMVRSGLQSRPVPREHEQVICHRLGQLWRRRVLRGAHGCEFQCRNNKADSHAMRLFA
jgi:hypothetical protein